MFISSQHMGIMLMQPSCTYDQNTSTLSMNCWGSAHKDHKVVVTPDKAYLEDSKGVKVDDVEFDDSVKVLLEQVHKDNAKAV